MRTSIPTEPIGSIQQEDRRRALEAGFDQRLVKPVDHGALTKLLAEVKE